MGTFVARNGSGLTPGSHTTSAHACMSSRWRHRLEVCGPAWTPRSKHGMCLRNDFHGNVLARVRPPALRCAHGNGFTFRVYGHAGSELCFDGTEYFPPTADKRKAFFVWTDLRSSLRNASRDNDVLITGSDKQLSDLAFLAQWPNQVSVPPRVEMALGHH